MTQRTRVRSYSGSSYCWRSMAGDAAVCLERAPLASLFVNERAFRLLSCPICSDVMEQPYMLLACQHAACLQCWDKVRKLHGACPFCRVCFREQDLVLCRHLAGCLAEAHVRCAFGCGWGGQYQNRGGHEGECPISKVAARDFHISQLQRHLAKKYTKICAMKAGLVRKSREIHLMREAVTDAHAS